MIVPSLIGDTKIIAIFDNAFPEKYRPQILAEVTKDIAALYSKIVSASGKLAPWVGSDVSDDEDQIKGRVYSNAKQAAVFEYGAPRNGAFRVREHEQRLAHLWAKAINPIKVSIPTYSRTANITARPAFIPALESMQPEFVEGLQRAVNGVSDELTSEMAAS